MSATKFHTRTKHQAIYYIHYTILLIDIWDGYMWKKCISHLEGNLCLCIAIVSLSLKGIKVKVTEISLKRKATNSLFRPIKPHNYLSWIQILATICGRLHLQVLRNVLYRLTKAVTVQSMTVALAYRAGLKTGLDNLVAKYIRKFGLHSTSLSPKTITAFSPCTEIGRTSTSLHKPSSWRIFNSLKLLGVQEIAQLNKMSYSVHIAISMVISIVFIKIWSHVGAFTKTGFPRTVFSDLRP